MKEFNKININSIPSYQIKDGIGRMSNFQLIYDQENWNDEVSAISISCSHKKDNMIFE